MSNAVKECLKKIFDESVKSQSAMNRILKPSMDGAGTRMFPPRTAKNDEKFCFRIDKGEPIHGKPNMIRAHVQSNGNSDRKTIKEMAEKDPHAKISHTDIDTCQEATPDALVHVFKQFSENIVIE